MVRYRLVFAFALSIFLSHVAFAQQGTNLARKATATASESFPSFTPDLAVDGKGETRWSGIPGHNAGLWFQLDWKSPVTIRQILVRQYGRYTMEWDLQTWNDNTQKWENGGHYGAAGVHLPGNVYCVIDPPRTTTRIRLANISNGPTFSEIEVYRDPIKREETVEIASDLRGNFVGMVCDAIGDSPIAGRIVKVKTDYDTAIVKSSNNGMFFAPMPDRMRGEVTVTPEGGKSKSYRLEDFQHGLVPTDSRMDVTVLKDGWRIRTDPVLPGDRTRDDFAWPAIHVPAHWEMEGRHAKTGVAQYAVHFDAPKGNGIAMLRFDGVYSGAKVWVNGTYVAGHLGGFTPFETDITTELRPKNNLLIVEVREKTDVSELLDKMSQYSDFSLGGITRKVTVFRVPKEHIDAYEQATTFNGDRSQAIVAGRVLVHLEDPLNHSAERLDVRLIDRAGQFVATTSIADVKSVDRFMLTVPRPKLWNAESPYLYTLRFSLAGGQVLDQRIGLRQTEIKGTEILIDKSPVKFRGTCHHDQHPLMGRAVTPELTRQDLTLMKEANLNSLRTSHYPPIPELIEQADELGLYVEDEADFCWVGSADDLRFAPRIFQLTAEMIARDRNHPSVFMWSLCNESSFGYDFEQSHDWVRQIDPSRPTGAATSAWLEIATLHNPLATKRIHDNEGIDKPLLFDESIAPFQGIFNDVAEMWVDPGIRDYYGAPFADIYREFMKSKVTQGSMIWAWSDDLFCVPNRGYEYGREQTQSHFVEGSYAMPGRGIVGDAPWGVVDGWRRRKPEFWIVKQLHSPIKVQELPMPGGKGRSIRITNEYDFTNLSEVDTFVMGHKLNLNVPPHTDMVMVLSPADSEPGTTIVFKDKLGHEIHNFALPKKLLPIKRISGDTPALTIEQESQLSGETIHVVGANFRIAFDKNTGQIRRCVVNGHQTLLDLPSIHILPTATPLSPLPNRLEWHLDSLKVELAGRNARATVAGTYNDLKGAYVITISPEGDLDVHSSFTYSGRTLTAREVGMRFSVPRSFMTVNWVRQPDFQSRYPVDHIGRANGTAQAVYNHPETAPPAWPWSQDNTPLGSNDFRSTKRNFELFRVSSGPAAGVSALGWPGQAARAWLESDRTTVAINDWYGGTNVGWGEWITNYGTGRLIGTGDKLESTLRLRL